MLPLAEMIKPVKQQYDVIFNTTMATIGLKFTGSRLSKVAYLSKQVDMLPQTELAKKVKGKIEKYLKSKEKSIKVEVALNVTPFQLRVLDQLQQIPYGETRSYGDLAKILKTSPRAVGNACRNNPLPIIIPCHRVVAANGIGGYDGATQGETLDIKYYLLRLEGAV